MGFSWVKARRALVGDRAFYRAVMAIIIPVIIQNSISTFVNLLDNLMVGALGDAQMSGVSIANQLIFIFNLAVFGGLSGPGIFGAQFYGAGDIPNLRNTFRIKLLECIALLAVAFVAILGFDRPLISLFLQGEGAPELAAQMMQEAHDYLMVILPGLPAFALTVSYAGTLREMGETRLPMIASVVAVATNALFNYLLIFGFSLFGVQIFPRLEVVGAAAATVISRYVELTIVMVFTHCHHRRFRFIEGAYRSLKVPMALLKKVLKTGAPLLMNEVLWSVGMSALTAVYTLCGLTVVAALSITFTISNLFTSVFLAMGTAVSVMIGQALGAGAFEKARGDVWRLIAFAVALAAVMGLLLIAASPWVPKAYGGVAQEAQEMATRLLMVTACAMPLYAFGHCSYFTLRSGGKTFITFLFDSVFTWIISVPLAWIMVQVVRADIVTAYAVVESANLIKCAVGFFIVRSGRWIQNLTSLAGASAAEEGTA